jgi:hypothetical protein
MGVECNLRLNISSKACTESYHRALTSVYIYVVISLSIHLVYSLLHVYLHYRNAGEWKRIHSTLILAPIYAFLFLIHHALILSGEYDPLLMEFLFYFPFLWASIGLISFGQIWQQLVLVTAKKADESSSPFFVRLEKRVSVCAMIIWVIGVLFCLSGAYFHSENNDIDKHDRLFTVGFCLLTVQLVLLAYYFISTTSGILRVLTSMVLGSYTRLILIVKVVGFSIVSCLAGLMTSSIFYLIRYDECNNEPEYGVPVVLVALGGTPWLCMFAISVLGVKNRDGKSSSIASKVQQPSSTTWSSQQAS